jgi:hypothetical protein
VKPEDVARISPRLVWCSSTFTIRLEWAIAMPVGTLAIAEALAVQARNAVTRIDILFIGISKLSISTRGGRVEGMVLFSDRQRPRSSQNLPETVWEESASALWRRAGDRRG